MDKSLLDRDILSEYLKGHDRTVATRALAAIIQSGSSRTKPCFHAVALMVAAAR